MRTPCALVVVAACAASPKPDLTQTPSPSPEPASTADQPQQGDRVISLRGSNTIGFSLAPKLVRAFLESKGATAITMNDQSRAKETVWFHADLQGTSLWIEINAPGSKYGFQSLEKGYTDLVMSSRPITDDEAKRLAGYGDLAAPASEHVIAMDGIAVIVHPNNPITKLTTAQLANIFSGKTEDWSALGGPAQPIHVFGRDKLSGTHDALLSLVTDGTEPKAERVFEDSAELARTVQSTEGGIGYVGLPYIGQTKALAVQDGDAEAMMPTQFTVATEDYALSRRLFLYLPEKPRDAMARELVEFALSDAGQAVAADVGFVPLQLKVESVKVPASAPAGYVKLASTATRLSVDFRFKLKNANVDTKGLRDLDRLTHYLAASVNRGRKITLVGFTDAQGAAAANVKLGRERADSIASLLRQRGVSPDEVTSYGGALPVAPNDTPQGRARNRRVEVWLQ